MDRCRNLFSDNIKSGYSVMVDMIDKSKTAQLDDLVEIMHPMGEQVTTSLSLGLCIYKKTKSCPVPLLGGHSDLLAE